MKLDAQGQFVIGKRINIYDALKLFSTDLRQNTVIKRKYNVGNEVADGVITELLSEGLLEEPKHKRNWYRLTIRGQERNGVTW